MIIASGGLSGKQNNRISNNLKMSGIAASRGSKDYQKTEKEPERINPESNLKEFEDNSNQ